MNRKFLHALFCSLALGAAQAQTAPARDDTLYQQRTPADLPPGSVWVYDHPFYLLLNVAVGGDFPGPPDASTRFPQTMTVDYVRVYTK